MKATERDNGAWPRGYCRIVSHRKETAQSDFPSVATPAPSPAGGKVLENAHDQDW
jgi:hypothetical protein